MVPAAVLLACLLGLVLIWLLSSKPSGFPPGPPRWPLIGNLLTLRGRQPHHVLQEFSRQYGPVVGFFLIRKPVVVVSGVQEIREALSHPQLQARPRRAVDLLDDNRYGLLMTEGPSWQELRRFSLRYLRDLGVGRRHLEPLLHREARALLRDVRTMAGPGCAAAVPVHQLVNGSGTNLVLQLLAGERFERDDPHFLRFMELMRSVTANGNATGGLAEAFPWLLKMCPSLAGSYSHITDYRKECKTFIADLIDRHRTRPGQADRTDLLDYFLLEMDKRDLQDKTFNEKQLHGLCKDLFLAGSETTAGALSLSLLYTVLYPRVQARVHEELDAVVGRERLPGLDDRQSLTYVEATLSETLRMGSVVPLGVPHAAASDVYLREHYIPRGTLVLLDLHALHMDPELWGDPQVFRPERFLDEAGRALKQKALLPFGLGKRVCLGESMARDNLLLTFSTLLQHFTLSVPEGTPPPSAKPEGGFTLSAPKFSVQVRPRFDSSLFLEEIAQ